MGNNNYMKRNKIILGTAGIVAAAALMVASPWNINTSSSAYSKQALTVLQEQNATDAAKWLEARLIDPETGERMTAEKMLLIQKAIAELPTPKSNTVSFYEQGPDNIGGRTRAILPNRNNIDQLWAGSVSGGLFVSNDRSSNWTRVESYFEAGGSPYISSMAQTANGTIFVATGSNQEGWNGNGLWYSQDNGVTWDVVPGTSTISIITEVVASAANNTIYYTNSSGLKSWTVGDASSATVSGVSGNCTALKISVDGNVIVGAFGSNKTHVSTDAGATWTDCTSSSNANPIQTSSGRIEYTISQTTNSNGKYSIYAARTSANLIGMNVSHDNGENWYQFIGASGTPSNLDIYRDQGTYNSILSVSPESNEKILIGGIDIWKWEQTVNNPPSGGFEKLTNWFASPSSNKYVHADNHEMKWDANNRLYIGNDGGVGVTDDYGLNNHPANRGYNVTQFYGIAFDNAGAVMGGAQDNGTLYNDHTNGVFGTNKSFVEVNGGDGFNCAISFYNPKVMFSTIYYNAISRSGDAGVSFGSFGPTFPSSLGYDPLGTGGNFHPFHSSIFLAEHYDLNSRDSVTFTTDKDYALGETIKIPSKATGDTILYVAPTAIDDSTSLTVQDPFQSWFVLYVNTSSGGELWATRDALRLSVLSDSQKWACIAKNVGGNLYSNIDVEFTSDLSSMFFTCGSGVYRVDGLGDVYSSDADFEEKVDHYETTLVPPTATTTTKIYTGTCQGIAVNKSNSNDLMLLLGGSNKRSLDAMALIPSYTTLSAIATTSPVSYDGIIDRDNSNLLVVGTSNGAFVSEDGGASWYNASAGFENTPVYMVLQSWNTFDQGNARPGEIHLGTYGRGIWSSESVLGLTSQNGKNTPVKATDLNAYPNPTMGGTNISFNLNETSNVTLQVYTVTGKLVQTITEKQVAAGKQIIQIDGAKLQNGTYIVKMNAGKQSGTTKFIKM
jgi:hypothetical protein